MKYKKIMQTRDYPLSYLSFSACYKVGTFFFINGKYVFFWGGGSSLGQISWDKLVENRVMVNQEVVDNYNSTDLLLSTS
jgi:hypothetical protein